MGRHVAQARGTANIQSCLGEEREIKRLSTKQMPQPGELLADGLHLLPFLPQPRPCLPQPHPLGADPLLASEAFPTLPTRQAQAVGRGHLGSGAREEPRWLELDRLEGVADTGPVSFSGVWSRRMDSSHLEDVGTVTGSSPLLRQLAQPHALSEPSVPSKTVSGSQPGSS